MLTAFTTNLVGASLVFLIVVAADAGAGGRLDGGLGALDPGLHRLVTAGDEDLRGKSSARFEGATLAGLGVGIIVAPADVGRFGASPSWSMRSSTASRC